MNCILILLRALVLFMLQTAFPILGPSLPKGFAVPISVSKIYLNSTNEIMPSFVRSCLAMMAVMSLSGTSMPSFCMALWIFSFVILPDLSVSN